MESGSQGPGVRRRRVLDPQVAALIAEAEWAGLPPPETLSIEALRADQEAGARLQRGAPEPVFRVEDISIPGPAGSLPLRVYTPEGRAPFPVLVFFHGGGFVACSLDTHDCDCRALAKGAGCLVVSVGYRLAPEAKFPAAVEDAYAATCWAAAQAAAIGGDARRLAVGGDSAGGNLAAAVALMARDRGGPPLVFQLLLYPALNLASFDTDSYRENGEGYMVTRAFIERCRNDYLAAEADARSPYASPLLAADLRGLPPAFVMTAEFDPLRDEGEAYAARLREAGVSARVSRYDGMVHAFFSLAGVIDRGYAARAEAAAELRSAFDRP